MPYETSYDTGLNPFNHDKTRGKWSRPTDFLFACIGHAFKLDTVFIVTSYSLIMTGIYGVLVYFLVVATCVMPIVFLQSFLGQFSSTGFISVFRISPLFKGIGFVSLVLNLVTLSYYSIFAAVPLFFFLNTLRPTIPWSCEGIKSWIKTNKSSTTPCEDISNLTSATMMDIPAIEFLLNHFNTYEFRHDSSLEGNFSWPLLMCTATIWILAGVVMTRSFDVISKFLRYSCIAVCSIIGLFLLQFAFLPGAFIGLPWLLTPRLSSLVQAVYSTPVVALTSLGPGWGSTLTMASFNKFKANIFDFSWIICLAHFGIVLGLAFTTVFAQRYLRRGNSNFIYMENYHSQWVEVLTIPSALTLMGLGRILTLIFFGMVILGSMSLIIVQLLSVLTSLFDEYPRLRSLKNEMTVGLIGSLGLISIYACSNHGIHFFSLLSQFSLVTQTILNLLLLFVAMWIYGREKFQRDLHFMTERVYPTWMVNVVRFIAPLSLGLVLLIGYYLTAHVYMRESKENSLAIMAFLFIALAPWLLVPGYCAFKIFQTNGVLKLRIQRGLRPTDWYPVEPEDRQRYDQLFNKTETAYQLTTNME